jgi:hypothetical protein
MRRATVMAIAILAFPGLAGAATINDFGDGKTGAIAILETPGFSSIVNLSIPAECFVISATANITGMAAPGNSSAFPTGVELTLNGSVLWAFNGTGYGPLGRQDRFSNGSSEVVARFGPAGGSAKTTFKLPMNANVTAASIELDCSGPVRLLQLADIISMVTPGQFGGAVSSAGDFNADGFGDFLVGARTDPTGGNNAGRAFLYYGGPTIDRVPDLTFTGGPLDMLGSSVADAGDLNGDGYDDIAIGASRSSAVANEAGRVLLYFGGPSPDAVADVVLNGSLNERFGSWVDGLGDFNGDGYDDLAVSSDTSNISNDPGKASIFLGGSPMDPRPDVLLKGEAANDYFGWPAVGAGDLNGDGYGDLAVGAILNDAAVASGGSAYVFFGGPVPDNSTDVVMRGRYSGGWLGYSVAGAGDFDGDGFDDLLAGAPNDYIGGTLSGAGYLFRGGPDMDNIPDMALVGAPNDRVGHSVSGAGDVNGDGFDDIIAGASFNSSGGAGAGAAYVYFGGRLDNTSDMVLSGGQGDSMGWPVSGAGNVNGDGMDDLLIGEPYCDIGGNNAGRLLVVSQGPFVSGPGLRMGSEAVWDPQSECAGTKVIKDLSGALNRYLATAGAFDKDAYGNLMADIPVELFSGGQGDLTAGALNISYGWSAPVPDLSGELNRFIVAHKGGRDIYGNLTIPLEIWAESAGRVDLSGLNISIDEAPFWKGNVPPATLDEDTAEPRLLDLRQLFQDDFDLGERLKFSVVSADPPGIVDVGISDRYFLSADAQTGAENDNWTGGLSVVVCCSDGRGLTRYSDAITITVEAVNDAPAVTSAPVTDAFVGQSYDCRLTAVDAEADPIIFTLVAGPQSMTLDQSTRMLSWKPKQAGSFPVSVSVSDGVASTFRNFTIIVSDINKDPIFVSTPVSRATAGIPYEYDSRAIDLDGDELEYSLVVWPGGMSIGPHDGRIDWTPSRELSGDFSVAVRVSDGNGGEARQQFMLNVSSFVRPRITVTRPPAGRTVSGNYTFVARVERGTMEIAGVQLRIDEGEWMNATGDGSWGIAFDTRTLAAGDHTLQARAIDASGISDTVSVRFRVDDPRAGTGDMAILAGILIVAICAGAAAAGLWMRRRWPKRYDWG